MDRLGQGLPALLGERTLIKGTLAAAATPLRDSGRELDEAAFGPLVDFLAAGGLDGFLALGTTGEGILLSVAERRRVAEPRRRPTRSRWPGTRPVSPWPGSP